MPLRDVLERIGLEFPRSHAQAFGGHPFAHFIRQDAPREVESALGGLSTGLQVQASAGAGQWAAVPWIAVFDEIVTETATQGYYVVYLFHTTEPIVHLSLNQGATATRAEFKALTREVLSDRASLMRRRVDDYADRLPVTAISLGSRAPLPGDYAAGHALGVTYQLAALPPEANLRQDLQTAIAAYKALTFRGGLDVSPETGGGEDEASEGSSLLERRQYKLHRRIERNPKAAKAAKKYHGVQCQGCGMTFGGRYGQIGDGFIEAHHLRPISKLEEGLAVAYDVATDFAVLCSNCHRMIHRTGDPADLTTFRALLKL